MARGVLCNGTIDDYFAIRMNIRVGIGSVRCWLVHLLKGQFHLTNAIILWNSVYMAEALGQLEQQGHTVVHPKTCTCFSGFSVVLKDSSYSKLSSSMPFSQHSNHFRGG